MNMLEFFTDPFLRAPTIASMLMGFSAALMGVFLFLQKRSLVGESLAHAAYPGVVLAILLGSSWMEMKEAVEMGFFLLGAFLSALGGYALLHFFQNRLRLSSDTSLCFVLTSFFGLGTFLASIAQFSHPQLYRKIHTYLYGQVATMVDGHIYFYAAFSLIVGLFFILFFKEIHLMSFDRYLAKMQGVPVKLIEGLGWVLTVLSIVAGIRSVGVVLISAMLIAPACAARQCTNRFFPMLAWAGLVGLLSGWLGNYFSLVLSHVEEGKAPLSVPTGPVIVLVASAIAVFCLFFSPLNGIAIRQWRIEKFRFKCKKENLLKALWRELEEKEEVFWSSVCARQGFLPGVKAFFYVLFFSKGWIEKTHPGWCKLTNAGKQEGARIVRLHRLWEVYLVEHLGEAVSKVHGSAETVEHLLTKEHESTLMKLLDHPRLDPHQQPIPQLEEKQSHG